MPASMRRSIYVHDGLDDGDWDMRLDPGERIGGPVRGRLAQFLRRSTILLVFGSAVAGAIAYRDDTAAWVSTAAGLVSTLLDRQEAATGATETASALAAAQPLEPRATPVVAEPEPRAEASTPEPASEAPAASEPPGRLTPPSVEPNNPMQARALAIGLHPGISPAVLAKLSDADFKNAAHAIKTALAETPDTGTFVWPARRLPERALFHVKFVAGAALGCRRYVVTVTLDNWLTTASPMENCPTGYASR